MNILERAEQRWLILYATRIKKQLHHHSSKTKFPSLWRYAMPQKHSKTATRADFFGKWKPTMTTNSDLAETVSKLTFIQNLWYKFKPKLSLKHRIALYSKAIHTPTTQHKHSHSEELLVFCKTITFFGICLLSAQYCVILSLKQELGYFSFVSELPLSH